MPRTLSGKRVAALIVVLGVTGVLYLGLTILATRLHIQEINQSLNRSLAGRIAESKPLIRKERLDRKALGEVFDMLMAVNPAIEVYLLDPTGRILAYSAPPDKVKRARVSLGPVEAFLAGKESLPIPGDDPRDRQGRKVFSAAPILEQGRLQGYLYVVLGGEAYDSVAQMLERSHVLRLALATVVLSLLLIGTVGAVYFHWFTRRLAEMAQRIVEQVKELQYADLSRRELFANISHDLRTPLASLHGAIETLLMKEAGLGETEKRHYLNLALKHSEHLGRLTGELFELATLESADRELQCESFSMAELVQDVAQKFRPEAERRKLSIECEVAPDAPFVAADIGLIERVFDNLIENAIRYTPEGGTIRLSVIPGRDCVSAQVADTGRGIPAPELRHIFDRRYRADRDRKDRPGGAGLGLAIAQKILQLHGSSMGVESVVGAGTTFRFSLATRR